jgi:hypothetical protein
MLEARSLVRYAHRPSVLTTDSAEQRLTLNELYADHSLSVHRRRRNISHQYGAGIAVRHTSIRSGFSLYAVPSWQWSIPKWNASLHLPLVWTAYPGADFSRRAASPSLSVRYKHSYAWSFSLSGSDRESYGDPADLYAGAYRTDYRHTTSNGAFLAVFRQQSCAAFAEYKRTVRELFASLSLQYHRRHGNRLYEQMFEGEQIILRAHERWNISSEASLGGNAVEGFLRPGPERFAGLHPRPQRGRTAGARRTYAVSPRPDAV